MGTFDSRLLFFGTGSVCIGIILGVWAVMYGPLRTGSLASENTLKLKAVPIQQAPRLPATTSPRSSPTPTPSSTDEPEPGSADSQETVIIIAGRRFVIRFPWRRRFSNRRPLPTQPNPPQSGGRSPTATQPNSGELCQKLEGEGDFDLVIIPDKYTDANQFLTDARDAVIQMKSSETKLPESVLSKFRFLVYTDLSKPNGCTILSGTRHIDCDRGLTAEKQRACGGDSRLVIMNNTTKAGTGYIGENLAMLTTYTLHNLRMRVPMVLGFSVASLNSEWDFGNTPGPGEERQSLGNNCSEKPADTSQRTCPKWVGKDYEDQVGCIKGCGYSDWYRSTETSIMRSNSAVEFNPPSIEAWQSALQNY